jgi:shikimate dehydrogenase
VTGGGAATGATAGAAAGAGAGPDLPVRAAVLGHPVAHSLSPVLHRAAYAALGLPSWTYRAIDVDEAELPAFLDRVHADNEAGAVRWAGLSLTMPLKRAVRPLLPAESALAAAVGAVNTVTFGPHGTIGDNTDVAGIVAALAEAGVVAGQVPGAAILGGGATATSALAALHRLGCATPTVHARRIATTAELRAAAGRLGAAPRILGFGEADLAGAYDLTGTAGTAGIAGTAGAAGPRVVVSTLPPAAADTLAEAVTTALCRPGPDGPAVLLDVVYAPWPTALARRWAAAGGVVVGGFAMLVHQAVAQVQLMTGQPGPLAAMRAAGEAELARRSETVTSPSTRGSGG